MARLAASPRRPAALSVVIVSDNIETLDGLQTYLGRAGVTSVGTRRLGNIPTPSPDALVVFPDDYPFESVIDLVRKQARTNRERLIVLVTGQPKRYAEQLRSSALAGDALVIPRPAWGWTILDAMRAHFEKPV